MTELPFSQSALETHYRDSLKSLLTEYGHNPSALVLLLGHATLTGDTALFESVRSQVGRYTQLAAPDSNPDAETLHRIVSQTPHLTPEAIVQERELTDGWRLQYNQIRACRPQRAAAKTIEHLKAPFSETDFNFTLAALEEYYRCRFDNIELSFIFNKFPFSPLHTSIVPDIEGKHPQYLNRIHHDLAWHLSSEFDGSLPPTLAYNAYGAYASINHLHFQLVFATPLPLTSSDWEHNGGDRKYPLSVHRFEDLNESWGFIEQLYEQELPFNVIYIKGTIYVIPRSFQGSRETPTWNTGFGWLEVAGKLIVVDKTAFETLDSEAVTNALAGAWVTV